MHVPCRFLMPLTMPEGEAVEAASPEHGWQLDSPTRACLRTLVVGADGSPILHHIIVTINLASKIVYIARLYKPFAK